MMQQEFEKLIGHDVALEEYEVIQLVYTYHPLIPEINGKKKIAEVFQLGGMGLIREMLPVAEEGMRIESDICEARKRADKAKAELDAAQNLLLLFHSSYHRKA